MTIIKDIRGFKGIGILPIGKAMSYLQLSCEKGKVRHVNNIECHESILQERRFSSLNDTDIQQETIVQYERKLLKILRQCTKYNIVYTVIASK